MRALLTIALILVASPVLAQEPPTATGRWEARATASWVTLGGSASRDRSGAPRAHRGDVGMVWAERRAIGWSGVFALITP